MITLASIMEKKYTPELVDDLTNKTYQRLLAESNIKNAEIFPFMEIQTPKMEELRKVLSD